MIPGVGTAIGAGMSIAKGVYKGIKNAVKNKDIKGGISSAVDAGKGLRKLIATRGQ